MFYLQQKPARPGGLFRRLALNATLAVIAGVPAQSTVLFQPVGHGPEVFSYEGTKITAPLTSTNSLKSPKLYLIFLGKEFGAPGSPSSYTTQMLNQVKAMVNSNYFSGLTQYGSDGHVTFSDSDYTIDTSFGALPNGISATQMWDEIEKYLDENKSWLPAADGLHPPVYAVVHYEQNASNPSGGFGGVNIYGTVPGLGINVSAFRIGIGSPDQTDQFTWALSHELVERIYSGTGGFAEVSPQSGAGAQICDGEPESGNGYDWRIGGASGPMVTSYWSAIDQAFIVPDGNLDRVLVIPVWDASKFTHTFLSLQQGTLYLIKTPDQRTVIDTAVQSFTVNRSGGVAQIFDLTADGQVKIYNGSPGVWVTLAIPSMATALVSTSYTPVTPYGTPNLSDSEVYMLAGGSTYQYNGSAWIGLPYKGAKGIAAAGGHIYQLVNPGKGNLFVVEDWSDVITSSTTSVNSIVSAEGVLYMLTNDSQETIWRYDASNATWKAVTDSKTSAFGITAAGDVLVMWGSGAGVGGAFSGVAQYALDATNWIPLTGTNSLVTQILVQDGSELYMLASNNLQALQIWQFDTPGDWTALTSLNTTINSVGVDTGNLLHMNASIDGGFTTEWTYEGTPFDWIIDLLYKG